MLLLLFGVVHLANVVIGTEVSPLPPPPLKAAVTTNHNVRVYHVPTTKLPQADQLVEIESNHVPLHIHFKTASSRLHLTQAHRTHASTVKQVNSVEEPNVLINEISRPIIQTIREVIKPERKIVRELVPVQETIETVVAKDEKMEHKNSEADVDEGRHYYDTAEEDRLPMASDAAFDELTNLANEGSKDRKTAKQPPMRYDDLEWQPSSVNEVKYLSTPPTTSTPTTSKPNSLSRSISARLNDLRYWQQLALRYMQSKAAAHQNNNNTQMVTFPGNTFHGPKLTSNDFGQEARISAPLLAAYFSQKNDDDDDDDEDNFVSLAKHQHSVRKQHQHHHSKGGKHTKLSRKMGRIKKKKTTSRKNNFHQHHQRWKSTGKSKLSVSLREHGDGPVIPIISLD